MSIVKLDVIENKCRCGSKGEDEHSCPYAEEINDDFDSLCNCCSSCEQDCCDDI